MRKIVDRILEGKFDYEKGPLDFSCVRIELSLDPDTEYTGSFSVLSHPGKVTEGFVYSHDVRMKILTPSFGGTGEEIGYVFSTKGLSEGDVVKGNIDIVSNQGEYNIPYVVSITHKALETSLGSIKNLFHFTNLAKANWAEAVRIFYSNEFTSLLKGNDRQYLKTYLGLSRCFNNEQNVEEFLLEINKKHPVEFIAERKEIIISDPMADVMDNIVISRNGWGYTSLNVETDSDFVAIEKTTLCDDDFLGNYLKFPIVILNDLLHEGNNYATVRFYNSFTSFDIKISVIRGSLVRSEISRNLEFGRAINDLMTYFIAFRTKKISTDMWIAESKKIVDRLQILDENNLTAKLYKAQILLTEERYNEAKWLLDQAETQFHERKDYTGNDWAYFLYLTTLHNRDERYIDEITGEIENIYNMDTSKWRIAWLLLYLSEEYAVSPTRRWVFIESQLKSKCISPVFYVEAVNMLIADPALLTKLDNYEQRILRYAVRNDLMSDELARQFVYLAGTKKVFTPSIFEILKKLYEKSSDTEVLEVICEILIQADKKGPEYFEWYNLGVEKQCHATRLYEYYMMSIDIHKDVNIPKMVFLYFSYHSDLDWQHNAYLYSKVITIKNEEPELFISYKDEIDKFAHDSIMKNRINHNLAVIYKYAINESVLSEELAIRLSSLIFTHRISIDNQDISRVIVYQCRENVESAYQVEEGEAYIPLYTKDFTIIFEDNFSNRYMKSVPYDLEKMMVPGKLATMLSKYVDCNLEYDVYLCECSSEMVEIDDSNRERYQRILDSFEIGEDYKAEIRSKLMQYYYENDRIRELDSLLESLEPTSMNQKERASCIRYMVYRGLYDKAMEWCVEYGIENVDAKDLLNLSSRLIGRGDVQAEDKLLAICSEAFYKGKYDENVLQYLSDNYCGMTKDRRKIYTAAENFDIDIFKMCESSIIQMLYTGYFVSERMKIYKSYLQGGADSNVRLAFLSQCSYEFFVKEQLMESFLFDELTKAAQAGEKLLLVCKLAYVKYYSENKREVDSVRLDFIKQYLDDFLNMGIYMSFFKEFMEEGVERINNFSDKTIIEYKTEPGRKVMIHYIIESDDEVRSEYITREMKDMYAGVHAKSFVLFFGENLLYYITEENDDKEMLTQSGSISKSDIGRDIVESRFNAINDIVIARTLQDYDTAQNLIDEYYRKDYVVKKLFELQ